MTRTVRTVGCLTQTDLLFSVDALGRRRLSVGGCREARGRISLLHGAPSRKIVYWTSLTGPILSID